MAEEAVRIHGGYGFMDEYDVVRFYRDAKIIEIYEGTKEIGKLIVSSAIFSYSRERVYPKEAPFNAF